MKKVSVIGHYAYGLEYLDGQTIKTKIITKELCKEYGETEVLPFDTHGGVKTLLKAPIYVWNALKKTRNVVILPARNGLRIFGRLLPWFRHFFKNRRIHYVVIGGWLPKVLESKRDLAKALKKFDGIYVETNTMKKALEMQGFENIFVLPNCKELTPLSMSELVYQTEAPYKLCTFSRVMREKGIEDAIEAVKAVNLHFGKIIYTLDIYGQVDSSQTEWFEKLKEDFPEYVTYGGHVPFDKSVEILKNYFSLLFPTYYEGEGFAGTVLDAMSAGVPVIASDWKYNREIISNDVGYLCAVHDASSIVSILSELMIEPSKLNGKKIACLQKSLEYKPENIVKVLIENLQ